MTNDNCGVYTSDVIPEAKIKGQEQENFLRGRKEMSHHLKIFYCFNSLTNITSISSDIHHTCIGTINIVNNTCNLINITYFDTIQHSKCLRVIVQAEIVTLIF